MDGARGVARCRARADQAPTQETLEAGRGIGVHRPSLQADVSPPEPAAGHSRIGLARGSEYVRGGLTAAVRTSDELKKKYNRPEDTSGDIQSEARR